MAPTVEEPTVRTYYIRFQDGSEAAVVAETLCKPDSTNFTYRLKRAGNLVGEYQQAVVTGWRLEESPAG